jgi:SAM-dependent methyltransferase
VLKEVAWRWSHQARLKRAALFRTLFPIDRNTRILDLGSEDGSNIRMVLDGTEFEPENVYIADIDEAAVKSGQRKYGFVPVVVGESESLPFCDKYFDIVYCSSVIEHVTVPKDMVWTLYSGREFRRRARRRQRLFANEIQRLGRQYFVQCPYKYFPIESHSMLPFVALLPRPLQISALTLTNKFWIKKTSPDWCLLDKHELMNMFCGAELYQEKVLGLTKSLMAVYVEPRQ